MIEVRDLTYSYKAAGYQKEALRAVNMHIRPGEFLALLGANGSGKTTLARHLNALFKPDAGKVLIDGLDTRDDENVLAIRQRVGYLFQNPENQLVASTVEEDVAFGPENFGCSPADIRDRVRAAISLVGMNKHIKNPIQFLSGGEKQSVALAGLLALKPRYLVLDEPTSMLDPASRIKLLQIIRNLSNEGYAVIYITHHIAEALLADRVIVMDVGKVVLEGKVPEIIMSTNLRNLKLEMPPLIQLINGLKLAGLDIPEDIYTIDRLVNHLCK